MDSWTPLFGKIVESSLWQESDLVVKVFLSMLAKRDADNVVRGTAYQIGRWAVKTEKEVLSALKVLSSPDTKRIEKQPFDGRRIEKVENGWLILNGRFYQELMQEISRKANNAKRQARYREKQKASSDRPLPGEVKYVEKFGKDGKAAADAQLDRDEAVGGKFRKGADE